jgi:hypothetical protein
MSFSISHSALPTFYRDAPPPLPADLGNLSLGQLNDLFADVASYDPALIQGSLNALGAAALKQSGGEFAVSTTAFDLKMKALDTSASASITMGSTALALPPLSSLGTGLAASMIQWTTNPYASKSPIQTDTPTLSLNILDTTGSKVAVNNLTSPITFSWALNRSDPRFQTPPNYLARCDLDIVYVVNQDRLSQANTAIQYATGQWSVPCLLDVWKPLNCTDYSKNSIMTTQCPSPILQPTCIYWSNSLSTWSTDGCTPSVINSTILCSCTHLTDFSSRINAIGESNAAIFANAADVYSVSGLAKYAQWFGIFGGIAALTLLLGILSMRIDNVTTKKYVTQLCNDEHVNKVFENAPNSAIYVYDRKSTRKCTQKKIKQKTTVKEVNLCTRIWQQHNRLQFLFRYDPRLARIFRLLSLFTIQYHSLFVTALLYGFTYGGGPMMWYDVIALSIITSLLNVPVISTIVKSLDVIGMREFRFKFPLLCEEYERRCSFEKYALVYLSKEPNSEANIVDNRLIQQTPRDDVLDDESIIDLFFLYICCRNPPEEKEDTILDRLSRKELAVKMIKVLKQKYRGPEVFDPIWSNLPCHTKEGYLFLLCSAGWIAWCLNYLLLFAAAHPTSVGESVLTSYATAELVTVFLTQPITIIITFLLMKINNAYGKRLPKCLQRYVMISTHNDIPALLFFSNPWKGTANSEFTSEFAYSLFVKCPALASNTSEAAYAPTKALIEDMDHEKEPCEVEKLYNVIRTMYQESLVSEMSVRTV